MSFGWHYPPGTMRGSGIFAEETVLDMECDPCGFNGEVDVHLDDWRTASWDCPTCHTQHHGIEIEPPDHPWDEL